MWIAIIGFGAAYGAVLGSYGGASGPRAWQVVYSAAKVPLLLIVTFALSLPSFFVVNTLLGFRARFGDSLRALVSAQACLTIVLASFAPVTLLWYASWAGYRRGPAVQCGLVRGREPGRAGVASAPVRAAGARPSEPAPPAAGMARDLRVRRHPDGVAAAPVRRLARADHAFLPRRRLGNAYVEVARTAWRLLTEL